MDYEILVKYIGREVKLTLNNGFWYKAKILSVNLRAVEFVEMRGRKLCVVPNYIISIEEIT